jgi:hypothetical protein
LTSADKADGRRNGDDAGNFCCIASAEVTDFSDLPREVVRVRNPRTEIRRLRPWRA